MRNITILEIEEPIKQEIMFPLYAGTYVLSYQNDYDLIANSYYELDKIGFITDRKIINISAERKNYQKTSTLQLCIQNTKGGVFYDDEVNKFLYIHFENHKPPEQYANIYIGVALGFIKTRAFEKGFYDDFFIKQYDNRLLEAPLPLSNIDDRVNLEQKFESSSFTIINTDLKYAQFNVGLDVNGEIKRNKTGNFCRVSYIEGDSNPTYADLESSIFYIGYINTITEGKDIKIQAIDTRKKLDKSGPSRKLNKSIWSFVSDTQEEIIIPEIWGSCKNIPLLCLNEKQPYTDSSLDNYFFLIGDYTYNNLKEVTTIYINGEEIASSDLYKVINYDENSKVAYLSIPKTVFPLGKDITKVSADVEGYVDENGDLIEKTLSIVKHMIINSYNLEYSDIFFNTTKWELLESYSRNAYYYLDSEKKLYEKINDLQKNIPGTQFIIDLDRRFSWEDYRYIDRANSVVFRIKSQNLIAVYDIVPDIQCDASEVAAYVKVSFSYDYYNKKYSEKLYNSNSAIALDKYNSELTQEYATFLSDNVYLDDFSSDILAFNGFSQDTFDIVVPSTLVYNNTPIKDIKAGQYIEVELNPDVGAYLNWVTVQILKKELNDDNNYTISCIICYKETDNFRQSIVFGSGETAIVLTSNLTFGIEA